MHNNNNNNKELKIFFLQFRYLTGGLENFPFKKKNGPRSCGGGCNSICPVRPNFFNNFSTTKFKEASNKEIKM